MLPILWFIPWVLIKYSGFIFLVNMCAMLFWVIANGKHESLRIWWRSH